MSRKIQSRAFAIAELLISLAITAMLLTSMAVGTHAYLKSYEDNECMVSLTEASRFVLSRMMLEVRTAADVDSTAAQLTITPVDDGSRLDQIQYEYTGGQLHYRLTGNEVQTDQILIGDSSDHITITEFSVLREENPQGVPVSVKVRLALTRGAESLSMTASAVIRGNQEY